MQKLISINEIIVILFVAIVTGLFIALNHKLLVVELVFFAVLIAFILIGKNFAPIILILSVLRPIIDIWSEYRIGFIGIQMVMTVGIVCSALFYLFTNKNNDKVKLIIKDPAFIFWTIYILINFISILINPKVAINASLSLTFRFISFGAMYMWGQFLFNDKEKQENVIATYIVALVIISLVAYYQILTGQFHAERGVLGLQGTFRHPNMFANFIILSTLGLIYFIIEKKYILVNSCITLSSLYLFMQTYSRMALAVLIIVLVLLALSYKKGSLYVIPLIIVFSIIIFYKYSNILNFWLFRFENISDPNAVYTARAPIFDALWSLFKENMLIGIGPSTFHPYYYLYAQPHNEILRNFAEVGLMGTIPFLLFWVTIFKRFFTLSYFIRKTDQQDKRKFIVFLMICAISIISLTSNVGTKPELLWPMFLLFGSYYNYRDTGKKRN